MNCERCEIRLRVTCRAASWEQSESKLNVENYSVFCSKISQVGSASNIHTANDIMREKHKRRGLKSTCTELINRHDTLSVSTRHNVTHVHVQLCVFFSSPVEVHWMWSRRAYSINLHFTHGIQSSENDIIQMIIIFTIRGFETATYSANNAHLGSSYFFYRDQNKRVCHLLYDVCGQTGTAEYLPQRWLRRSRWIPHFFPWNNRRTYSVCNNEIENDTYMYSQQWEYGMC